jgi:hypothetical protein
LKARVVVPCLGRLGQQLSIPAFRTCDISTICLDQPEVVRRFARAGFERQLEPLLGSPVRSLLVLE